MNRKIQMALLGALALQGVLIAVTWTTRGGGSLPDPEPLLDVDKGAVTALEITEKPTGDEQAATVRLEKSGDGWIAASAGGFPAKKKEVEDLVEKLTGLKVRDPIATQKGNHNALRVGGDVWGRKVKVTAGGQTRELVVGSGPGSSVHVRFADADAVYRARGVSEYAVSGRVSSYVDTEYVKVDTEKLTEIQVTNPNGTLSFRKQGADWVLAELPEGQTLDQGQAKSFASAVARLSLKEPVGKTVDPAFGLDSGVKVTLTYNDEGGAAKSLGYAIGAAKDGAHYVKADGQDFVVLVAEWATKSAREKSANDFVKKAPSAEAGSAPGGMPPIPLPGGLDPHAGHGH